ncbi:tripartite motif-containing protein 35 [Sarotherodon galilaeus]
MENEVPNQNPAEKVQNKVQCCNEEHVPGEDSAPMEEESKHSETDVKNRGDCKKETEKEESAAIEETTSGTSQAKTQEASETTVSPNQAVVKNDGDCKEETQKKDKSAATKGTTSASEESRDKPESTTQDTQQLDGHSNDSPTTPEASQTEERQVTSGTSQAKTQEASETTVSPNQAVVKNDGDCKEETQKKDKSAATKGTTSASEESRDKPESTTQDTQQLDGHSNDSPTTPEASQTEERQVTSDESRVTKNEPSELTPSQIPNDKKDNQVDELEPELNENISTKNNSDNHFGDGKHFRQPESPPQANDVRHIDVFLRQLEKVKTRFPNQRAELWNRGRIHLKRHLQTTQPTEPVSLILTAGLRAEKTLNCLARDLASAYSSARNTSVLHIDGASKASQDSDLVKLDIDRKLQAAFEGDKPVAVIHRFEELPPGSTLVFYRYCDHKNAAYKNTFLIFTVLLGEEDEIPAKISLCAVEEMVDDHLQKKFLTHGHPVSFDSTVHHIFPGPYLDKYGGLWSRISHLILPVAAEERIELEGSTPPRQFDQARLLSALLQHQMPAALPQGALFLQSHQSAFIVTLKKMTHEA